MLYRTKWCLVNSCNGNESCAFCAHLVDFSSIYARTSYIHHLDEFCWFITFLLTLLPSVDNRPESLACCVTLQLGSQSSPALFDFLRFQQVCCLKKKEGKRKAGQKVDLDAAMEVPGTPNIDAFRYEFLNRSDASCPGVRFLSKDFSCAEGTLLSCFYLMLFLVSWQKLNDYPFLHQTYRYINMQKDQKWMLPY